MTAPDLLLVGVGPHAHYKHLPGILKAVRSGLASSYSILELETARPRLEELVRTLDVKPERIVTIPDHRERGEWYTADSDAALEELCRRRPSRSSAKVMICTEPKAHFPYIRWCLANGRDCLVDKPITIPMSGNVIDPRRLTAELRELIDLARESPASCSVMTPRRYHHVYETVRRYMGWLVRRLGVPVTYLSIYHGEGVWNTPTEYLEREDHPYKYGYGKLLHSGYHYVDILARLLELSGMSEDTVLDVASHVARPGDQQAQMAPAYGRMDGAVPVEPAAGHPFGETDFVASFAARRRGTGEVVTLGNLALLQTTTSLRNWWRLPDDVYNKTGRFGVEDIRLNLGFLASISVRILKVPVEVNGRHATFRDELDITVWRNGNLLGTPFVDRRSNRSAESYLEAGRWRLFRNWLQGRENRSRIEQHLRSVEILEALLLSQARTASNNP
jgi:predicted dehydrogenase